MIKENGTYHSDCPAGKDKGQNHTQNQISESGGHNGSATYNLYKDFFIEHKIHMESDMEVLALPLLEEKKLVQIPLNCDIPKRFMQIVSDKERGKSLAADTFYKYLKNEVKMITSNLLNCFS